MSHDWMIDVLADLRSFAQQNGFHDLAEHLDDTILVAVTEINSDRGPLTQNHANTNRSVPGTRGAL